MRRLFIMICLVLSVFSASAQYRTSSQKPVWLDDSFKDGQYSYVEVVYGVGYDEGDARDKALQMIIKRRNMSTGARAKVSISGDRVVVSGSDELTVKARVLDEFVEHVAPGQWRVSLLVQTAKNPEYPFENVTVTDKYPVSARVLIPGMAQIHKGSTGKGLAFIAGEVALVGGIVFSEAMRTSNINLMSTTHNTENLKIYMDRSQTWMTARNICIAAAAALYVWNIVDAVAARGKSHLVIGDYASIGMAPYVDNRSAGMSLAMKF